MTWRNCEASLRLVGEVNTRWPGRDKSSDGTIGDAAHATRASDHNPFVVADGIGVVRARDIDKDGIDAAWLAEYLRLLGAKGDPRLAGSGYVIFNERITSADFKTWRAYTGSNPHTKHMHVSFSLNRAGYDSPAPWGISTAALPIPNNTEDDLDANQARMLQVVYDQITGNNFAGWPTWNGGTGEKLSMVDYNRRTNVELRQAWLAVQQVHQQVTDMNSRLDQVQAGDIDYGKLASAVADELSKRMAA